MSMEQTTPLQESKNGAIALVGEASESSTPNAASLVRVEDEYGIAVWDKDAAPMRSSFDFNTPEGTQKASQMMVAADKKTRNVCGGSVAVTDYVCHGVYLTDRLTGEQTARLRVALMCDDGTIISIMSEPCVKSLAFIFRSRPKGPFNPPVYVAFKEVPTVDAKSYCVCWEIPAPKGTPSHRRGKQSEE